MNKVSNPSAWGWLSAVLAAGLCGACSASDSEIHGSGGTSTGTTGGSASGGSSSPSGGSWTGGSVSSDSGSTSTGGSSASTGGSSASASGGSSKGGQSANGGVASTAGTGGQSDTGGSGGDCAPKSSVAVAVHIVMNISWPDTLATAKGSGKFHLWNLSKYKVEGTALSGETQPCGSILPPLDLSAIAGGGKTLIEIPDATWDLPTMPRIPAAGKLAGWTAGSEFDTDAGFALVGLTLADPKAAWPSKGSTIMTVDHDGDSKPGIKGVPKSDGGFLRPPTSILGQAAAVADQVYLVTRTVVALNGAMTSCSEQAGTANVTFFDNHVVGCHVYNGGECDAAQADFIDTNRTIYSVTDASYTSQFVSESATCAEVRAALPL